MINMNITSNEVEPDQPAKTLSRRAFFAPALVMAGRWLAKVGVRLQTRFGDVHAVAHPCDCDCLAQPNC